MKKLSELLKGNPTVFKCIAELAYDCGWDIPILNSNYEFTDTQVADLLVLEEMAERADCPHQIVWDWTERGPLRDVNWYATHDGSAVLSDTSEGIKIKIDMERACCERCAARR